MAKLFVILSRTNTKIGTCIRWCTRYRFSHVSLSLEEDLVPVYSFARYYNNRPFTGGFTEESWLRHLNQNESVEFLLYTIELDDTQTRILHELWAEILEYKREYRYSIPQAVNTVFPKIDIRNNKRFSCLSFCVFVLRELGIVPENKQFFSIQALGRELSRYPHEMRILTAEQKEQYDWGSDTFMYKKKWRTSIHEVLSYFYRRVRG